VRRRYKLFPQIFVKAWHQSNAETVQLCRAHKRLYTIEPNHVYKAVHSQQLQA